MPRYELDGEPWQIEQIDKQLEITSGGKTTTRTFVTSEQAAAQLAKLTEERTQVGYVPMPRDPRHTELELAIANDPENPAGYSVFADWLQSLAAEPGRSARQRHGDRARRRGVGRRQGVCEGAQEERP
jgi:predicted DNA-binding WGR domain protein